MQMKRDRSSLSLVRCCGPELILIFDEKKFPVWKADKGSCQDPNPGLRLSQLLKDYWVRVSSRYEEVTAQSFQDFEE